MIYRDSRILQSRTGRIQGDDKLEIRKRDDL